MRYTRLDGLRGLLSIIVAFNHSFMVLAIPWFADIWNQNIFAYHDLQSKLQQLFMLVGNGGLAVSVFFVLSGFVLAESAKKWEFTFSEALTFYIRRLLRLYPVYLFLILFSALYMWSGFQYRTFPIASTWFHWWMNFEMTLKELSYNLTFVHMYIGGVTWTLRVILSASLVIPFMMYLSKKLSIPANILVYILLALATFKLLDYHKFNDFRYLYMFYLGILIPRFQSSFESISGRTIALLTPPLTLTALYFRYLHEIHLAGIVESFIAFLFLGILAYNYKQNIFNFLESQVFQFLGKISYSLYLVHWTVLYILSRALLENISPAFISNNYFLTHLSLFVVTTPMAIAFSMAIYKYIETPAQIISRKIRID